MSTRFNIATPRKKKDGGTYWVNIGTAWQSDKGIQLVFDALPLPDSEGRCVANLFEPRERDGQQRQNGGGGASMDRARQAFPGAREMDDLSDSIPFATSDSIW